MGEETDFTEKVMVGLLAMICADREERLNAGAVGRKPEVILAEAGLSVGDIARVTGRKYNTVKTIVRRGRAKSSKEAAGPEGTDNA